MNAELEKLLEKPTASVPAVGKICLGLGRNASYASVRRGDFHFPVMTVGGRMLVPTVHIRRRLVEGAA
jgi:hypothetical protein